MEARSPPGPHGGGHACTEQLLGFTTGLRASQGAGGCASGQMWKFKGNSIGFKAGLTRGCREGRAEEAAKCAARRRGGREENRAAGNKFFRASSTGKYIFVKEFYTLCFSEEIKITSQHLGIQLNFECYCRTEGKGP